MSIGAPPTWNTFELPPFPVRRFTVAEYHHMVQTGLLTEDEPVELLEGWIVPKVPRNTRHDVTLDLAQEVIRHKLPARWRIRIQSAITTDDSEPEPDLAIVLGPANRYLGHHPGAQDIAALIEVADTSLTHDRKEKGRVYARASVPIYWIINLVDSQVEVYTDPSGPVPAPNYRQRRDYGVNDSVPLVIGGQEIGQIAVRELLP